jgi:hypothetical protein
MSTGTTDIVVNTSEGGKEEQRGKEEQKRKRNKKGKKGNEESPSRSNRLEEMVITSKIYDMLSSEFDLDDDDEPHQIDKLLNEETINHCREFMKDIANKTSDKDILSFLVFIRNTKKSDKELTKVLLKTINSRTIEYWKQWLSQIDELFKKYNFEFN